MTQGIEGIEAAFKRVRTLAERVASGDESSKDPAYQEIFALNNEIGRLARQRPKAMPKMKELQGYVNMITVGIKYDRLSEINEGLAVTAESISAMKRDSSWPP